MKKKVASIALAIALSCGGAVTAATAAHAAIPPGCSQTAGVPYKTGSEIKGTGTGRCTSAAQRTLVYQVHRSEGFYHPVAVEARNSGNKTSYSATGQNCDTGSGSGTRQYFGGIAFNGWDASLSGNTGERSICG